jgi:hypothetical protein
MKTKVFSFLALIMFGFSLMSSASQLKIEEDVDCAVVFTVCDTAFPDNFALFERCMVNNGCGGDPDPVIEDNP